MALKIKIEIENKKSTNPELEGNERKIKVETIDVLPYKAKSDIYGSDGTFEKDSFPYFQTIKVEPVEADVEEDGSHYLQFQEDMVEPEPIPTSSRQLKLNTRKYANVKEEPDITITDRSYQFLALELRSADPENTSTCTQLPGEKSLVRKKNVKIEFLHDGKKVTNTLRTPPASTERPFQCAICSKTFLNRATMRVHIVAHAGVKLHCKYCPKAYARRSSLREHMRVHTGETFQCTLCPKTFINKIKFMDHNLTHSGERPNVCSICQKGFVRKSVLRMHTYLVHSGERPFTCPVCSKAFAREYHLKCHLPCGVRKSACSFCAKKYLNKRSLQRHILYMHTEDKPGHACPLCAKLFSKLKDLRSHLFKATHGGPIKPPFKCQLCLQSYDSKQCLVDHVWNTHFSSPTYTCSHCLMSFTNKRNLRLHLEANHSL